MNKRIIYLEDDDACREPLIDVLELAGHTVFGYSTAEDARPNFTDTDIDVAIIDVRLPGQGGDAFASELRHANPDIQIIFLTGDYKVDHLKEAVPDCLCLSKPVDVDVLLNLISR